MSITVDSSDAVSGFIQPGDKVDLVASFAQGSDSVARTILQDIPLLAVNGNLAPQMTPTAPTPTGEKPKVGPAETTTSVTIAVTPVQAERLVAAQYKGKLKLGLRGLNDVSRVATAGSSLNQMLGIPQGPGIGGPGLAPPKAQARVSVRKAPRLRRARRPGAGTKGVAPVLPVLPALPGAGPAQAGIPGQATIRVIRGTQVEDVPVTQ